MMRAPMSDIPLQFEEASLLAGEVQIVARSA